MASTPARYAGSAGCAFRFTAWGYPWWASSIAAVVSGGRVSLYLPELRLVSEGFQSYQHLV